MGRKIEVKETVNKDFNFAKQFFRSPLKWRPWHVLCLPYPGYATEINVTQPFTVKVSLVMEFLGNFFSNFIFEKLLSHEALVMGRVTATSNNQTQLFK